MNRCYNQLEDVSVKIIKTSNCPYFKKKQKVVLNQLTPNGLCISAYHTLIPYIHTLYNKGEFTWMKDRKKVIAQCPNPEVGVSFEVNHIEGSKFEIRIVQTKGLCPNHHKLNDSFQIDLSKINFCYHAFDALFPPLNELIINTKNKEKKIISCPSTCNSDSNALFEIKRLTKNKPINLTSICEPLKKQEIKAIKMERICSRYHLLPTKRYAPREPCDQKLCLEAYHICYPHCLALSYGASLNNNLNDFICLRCPSPNHYLKLKIIKKPKIGNTFFRFLDTVLKHIMPRDILCSNVYIQVVDQKGKCPKNIKKGNIFKFNNTFGHTELCPAAFDSLYPSMRLLDKKILPPWSKNGLTATAQCPDHITSIKFQLKRID